MGTREGLGGEKERGRGKARNKRITEGMMRAGLGRGYKDGDGLILVTSRLGMGGPLTRAMDVIDN